MKTIDLDQILNQLSPDRVRLKINGKTYTLKELSVVEVLAFDQIRSGVDKPESMTPEEHAQVAGEQYLAMAKAVDDIFDGESPQLVQMLTKCPVVDRPRVMALILYVVAIACDHFREMMSVGNRWAEAVQLARTQSTSSAESPSTSPT